MFSRRLSFPCGRPKSSTVSRKTLLARWGNSSHWGRSQTCLPPSCSWPSPYFCAALGSSVRPDASSARSLSGWEIPLQCQTGEAVCFLSLFARHFCHFYWVPSSSWSECCRISLSAPWSYRDYSVNPRLLQPSNLAAVDFSGWLAISFYCVYCCEFRRRIFLVDRHRCWSSPFHACMKYSWSPFSKLPLDRPSWTHPCHWVRWLEDAVLSPRLSCCRFSRSEPIAGYGGIWSLGRKYPAMEARHLLPLFSGSCQYIDLWLIDYFMILYFYCQRRFCS